MPVHNGKFVGVGDGGVGGITNETLCRHGHHDDRGGAGAGVAKRSACALQALQSDRI